MDAITVTVVRGGWWLPGRALAAGETLALDAATAEALARHGIVRIDTHNAASSADKPTNKPRRRRAVKED